MVVSHPARYIMVGGFLGAGKTTALLRLAEHYQNTGHSVWMITNDQGESLVDTQRVQAARVSSAEITGGCFCCRFNELLALASTIRVEHRPDIILAEPVGSCTDLRATVHYPMRLMYGRDYRIAPLSTLVDALQLEAYLGFGNLELRFNDSVQYIFETQLNEASMIVVNKVELLDATRRERLYALVSERFPATRIIMASMYTGEGLDEWFSALGDEEAKLTISPSVDYQVYADGEAALGWLNAVAAVRADISFPSSTFLQDLSTDITCEIAKANGKIAHLKISVCQQEHPTELTAVSLVTTSGVPALTCDRAGSITSGVVVINIRAEAAPELLQQALLTAISRRPEIEFQVKHLDAFRPGKPEPVHRIPNPEAASVQNPASLNDRERKNEYDR